MGYKLKPNESLDLGLRRIALEQIDKALKELAPPIEDVHDAIHSARKRFKKIRAVVRLVRYEMGKKVYKRENVFFRDLGRRLSPIRDAHVNVETLDLLIRKYPQIGEQSYYEPLKNMLEEREQQVIAQLAHKDGALEKVYERLKADRLRIQDWPEIPNSFDSISKGLKKVYKRGSKRLDDAESDGQMEDFHQWRKRVKYQWYHHRILNVLWPEILGPWADTLHDLSDYLGDEHDLAIFSNLLAETDQLDISEQAMQQVQQLIQSYREALQAQALQLGHKLYAEKPKAFIKRWKHYWDASQEV
jgi:CHAD domain-containing protein